MQRLRKYYVALARHTHPPPPPPPTSLLINQDNRIVSSFSLVNASLRPVCIIVEAHRWNNLAPSVMAPQAASTAHPCVMIVLETFLLKGTMIQSGVDRASKLFILQATTGTIEMQ